MAETKLYTRSLTSLSVMAGFLTQPLELLKAALVDEYRPK